MCSAITPAGNRRVVVLGVLCVLLLTPRGLVGAQEDPGDQTGWAPAQNAVSVGLHSFLDDGESGKRIGIWWAASRRVNLGVTWRAWDRYDVLEPEIRLHGRRQRRVSPFFSISGIRQLRGEVQSTGVGVGMGVEAYPRKGLSLSAAVGGRTIWRKWTSEGNEDEKKRESWFRLHAGVLVFPLALFRAATPQTQASAQEGRHFQVSGGLGISFPGYGRDGFGTGAGVSFESVERWTRWASGRLYVGGFLSSPEKNSCSTGVQPCSVSSRIGVAGAKVRLLVPIPYVGPFFELGAGLSAGSIETRIGGQGGFPAIDESHSGIMFHVPSSVGIAFGAQHQHDISFDYFTHRGPYHVAGTVALGIGFVLGGE